MALHAIEPEYIKMGRGSGTNDKGGKYPKYKFAIQKVLPFIKDDIENNGEIIYKTNDFKCEMGKEFTDMQNRSVYLGVKYVLFKEGIRVVPGKHTDGSDVLMMRKTTPDDTLPDFLEDVKL